MIPSGYAYSPPSLSQLASIPNLPASVANFNGPVIFSRQRLENINCIIDPTEERGGLYLGDTLSHRRTEYLHQYNIQAILSCAHESIFAHPGDPKLNIVDTKFICAMDNLTYEIDQHFQESYEFIESNLANGVNVLVHCHAGVSRSAALVLAYVMKKLGLSFESAFEFVKRRRPRIRPNENFRNRLRQFQKTIVLNTNEGSLTEKQLLWQQSTPKNDYTSTSTPMEQTPTSQDKSLFSTDKVSKYQDGNTYVKYQDGNPPMKYQEVTPSLKYQAENLSLKYQEMTPSIKHQERAPSVRYHEGNPSVKYQGENPSGKYQEETQSLKYQERNPTVKMDQDVNPYVKVQDENPYLKVNPYLGRKETVGVPPSPFSISELLMKAERDTASQKELIARFNDFTTQFQQQTHSLFGKEEPPRKSMSHMNSAQYLHPTPQYYPPFERSVPMNPERAVNQRPIQTESIRTHIEKHMSKNKPKVTVVQGGLPDSYKSATGMMGFSGSKSEAESYYRRY